MADRVRLDAVAAAAHCVDVDLVLPGGVSPPPEVREAALTGALGEFDDLRRLDMGMLAHKLGVSRSTLYRQAGDRDGLLGRAIWWRCRMIYAVALDQTQGLIGLARVNAALGQVIRNYQRSPTLRRFVDEEPQAAMRILTGPTGQVQPGFLTVTRRLLELEIAKADLTFSIDPETLAYAVVRLCESFMYADVLAVREPNIELGLTVVEKLLAGALSARVG